MFAHDRSRKILGVVIACALPILAILILLTSNAKRGLPATAQSAWDTYIQAQHSISPTRKIAVQQIVHATRPWNFTPQMSKAAYRTRIENPTPDSFHTVNLEVSPYQFTSTGKTIAYLDLGANYSDAYPPEDVWCVSLKKESGQSNPLVFVVLHQDLYSAYWLVHEPGEITSTGLMNMLAKIGCEMQLDS